MSTVVVSSGSSHTRALSIAPPLLSWMKWWSIALAEPVPLGEGMT